eukprot:m.257615 g.257615  ORF g.257615 m.257615 type:complete len:150 (+) comp54567_c0_seq48:314-763(+)
MSLKQKDALLDAYDIQCAISSDASLKLLLAVRQPGPVDDFFLSESSSSEPDSESSEPTKPTNEPPRNKATTPGLVGESAVAASSDRTAPGEVFSQGFVGSFPFVFVASSKDWSSSFAFRFRCLSFGPFIACSHLRIFHRSMLQAASETT